IVEQLGSGIPRILAAYGQECFQISRNFFRVVFPYAYPLPKHLSSQKDTEQIKEQAREHVGEHVGEQVKSVVLKIESEMSVVEIMAALELKGRRNFLQNYLQPALKSGFIEMTQPNSPKSPTQKYRLTEKGEALLGKIGDHV
ncbi:MAG: transcriptional regulator, partial [Desulfamplus sp.]|nr:transcriptional regulator [Desulfamplus sp.]